ncbi:hypothetical protein HJC23_004741 [Cyclotella cryptica]|uniref:S1 motif domain-containing protein n=1 Tax=Cyclotella cryptica TaxID=29204 RepID=A0ABD3NW16_9STRA|eukprot:CCRYP_019453-RA/>CCRYP_019453-RA protein AED:0.14 eAED:0.14 QI:0/-1/0/1/-1/1/1/0/129
MEGVEGEIDGFVHISALSEGRVGDVRDEVSVGDKVQVRIREIDLTAGRISLSRITKEQEEASCPAPRDRKERGKGGRGGQREVDPIGKSGKDTGASDWKESMTEFEKDQSTFTNTAVVVDRRHYLIHVY